RSLQPKSASLSATIRLQEEGEQMSRSNGRLVILYEHPEWFELLFGELERRSLSFERMRAECLIFDPETADLPDLVVNRMSPSAWKRGHANGVFAVREYLIHLEEHGVAVVNGSQAYAVEISKARQLDLF